MRSGEVSTTVMAFEAAAAFAVVDGGVFAVIEIESVAAAAVVVVVVVVAVAGVWEFNAEKADGLFFERRRGADERELREGLDVHEVMGLSLRLVHERKEVGLWGVWVCK